MNQPMPLSRTHAGDQFTVTDIRANQSQARRLLLLGVWEDSHWQVLAHGLDGSVVIGQQARRLTLRPGEAGCILGLPV